MGGRQWRGNSQRLPNSFSFLFALVRGDALDVTCCLLESNGLRRVHNCRGCSCKCAITFAYINKKVTDFINILYTYNYIARVTVLTRGK